jgi:putative nucleotidyltransferase with HDIG domain
VLVEPTWESRADRTDQSRVVKTMLAMMEARHRPTCLHLIQVADYAARMAARMGLPPEEIDRISLAGLLHDIGKIAIPDAILTKPDKLDDQELQIIRQHPAYGEAILRRTGGFEHVCAAVRHHHEWFDGSGYPDGLHGHTIPLAARIIAVADAFDTMTMPRPYRRPVSPAEAVAELLRCRGSQFDPDVVDLFLEVVGDPVSAHGPDQQLARWIRKLGQVDPLAIRIT